MKVTVLGYRACLPFLLITFTLQFANAETQNLRERLLLDFGWRFHLGNEWGSAQNLAKAGTGSGPASASFSDASWRAVNLPHDWAVELPFDSRADGSHGFKPLGRGYPTNSVAWYRRVFDMPNSDTGKRIWLEFDGVFRDCEVFVNGWAVGHHESGYGSFRYDITDLLHYGGKNLVAVKVDASEFEGWFYEGAGIYRHVWLVKTAPVAVMPEGTFIYSQFKDNIPQDVADLHIQTVVANWYSNSIEPIVKWEVFGTDGKSVVLGKKSLKMAPFSSQEVTQILRVHRPDLWSPEAPRLYRLVTTVEKSDTLVDRSETEFGIRTVAFDVNKGFLLNGQPYEIKGTCNHQDHAGVGAALPDRLQYFRVARLKEMGCNAYRTSHNPPTPELLQACDLLGMLVMDENRLLGSGAQNLERLEGLVRRDRNHPCVVVWSLANEEFGTQTAIAGGRVAATMQRLVKQLDSTRPVTYAANLGNEFQGINSVIEVRGWNYFVGKGMDEYHKAHPSQPNVGTEQGSTVSTRGIYANDKDRGYVSAYDDNAPSWAHTAETWWSFFAERPWLSGGFVWTGFDYRGEPTPYSWPCINSHFGILDTCGFPKDNFWYYRSWWTDDPVLHLLPHWNWQGKEGQEIDVRALSNCDQVELLLNGESLGRKPVKKNGDARWKVKFAPGTLSAKGFKADRLVAETSVQTTGAPAAVKLGLDRVAINADVEDISIITVSVVDSEGRVAPLATNRVEFTLEGPGRFLGVGNGDPSCHEPDVFVSESGVHAMPVTDGWRWKIVGDAKKADLAEFGDHFDDSTWTKADVQAGYGPLGAHQSAVFRTHFRLAPDKLAAPAIELKFGRIDEDGWVFVNGAKVGESHDWQVSPVFDIKRHVQAGENLLAVGVANYNGAGGINNGVNLEIQDPLRVPTWNRSVFNGLAQLIIQSTKESGEVKVTAKAQGLAPATAVIQSRACAPRPSVP
jgi:beta-galactosidase